MPTYEFRCPDGSIIERVFKMSEVPETIPSPNGDGVAVRIISGGADLIFKGSGFYITDYGKDGKKDQRAQSKPSGGTDAPSGAESKGERSATSRDEPAAAKSDKPAKAPEPKAADKKSPPPDKPSSSSGAAA